MSLQPGINPLDIGRFSVERGRFPTADEMKRATIYGPNPHRIGRFPTRDISAEEAMRKRTGTLSDPNYGPHNRPHYGPDGREIPSYIPADGPGPRTGNEALHTDPRTDPRLPGFKTLEYRPERDKSERRTLEYVPGRDKSEIQLLGGSNVWGPGPGEMHRYQNTGGADARQRLAERNRTAIEFRENMAQGIPNMGGFDASDLMTTPGMRQKSTRDQAEKVSAPYMEANRKAAGKTNPMNAASQEPGKVFLMKYVGK